MADIKLISDDFVTNQGPSEQINFPSLPNRIKESFKTFMTGKIMVQNRMEPESSIRCYKRIYNDNFI
jgi:hypothetical protein